MDLTNKIIRELASTASEKISLRVIATLQRMKESLLSGDDSGLTSVWDEVCVQVQGEESFYWDTYMEVIERIIPDEVRKLPEFVRQAIWLQTDQGFDWLCDAKRKENPELPVYLNEEIEEIVDYTFSYVLRKAEEWSNPRIRAYLEGDFTGR